MPEYDAWELTPKWHPRYWFGYDLRKRIWLIYSGECWWHYGRSKKVARDELERAYGR